MKKFSVIMAMDDKKWIGIKNALAWNIPSDKHFFEEITTHNEDLSKMNWVIMWRRTWESIPSANRPLDNRINCIVSKRVTVESIDSKIDDFVLHFNNFEHALEELSKKENVENIYVIWWSSVYDIALVHPLLDKVYLTEVAWDYGCDRIVDFDKNNFVLEKYSDWQEENWHKFRFMVYKKV